MHVRLLKAKLHQAVVTRTDLHYHGSITIAEDLARAVGLLRYEMVIVANCSTGARAETYVLYGPTGSGCIELNGAMARLAEPGDRVIIFSHVLLEPNEAGDHRPKVAVLNGENTIIEQWEG